MFKSLSLQAKNSLVELGRLPIRPQCQELLKLQQTKNFLSHELPIRYIHLIKLLSVNQLHPVLSRVLEDVNILQSTHHVSKTVIASLSKRMLETFQMVNAIPMDKNLQSQVYTLELSVKLLLEEWDGLEKGKELVQSLDFVKMAEEKLVTSKIIANRQAAAWARHENQTITVMSATGQPVNTFYIKSHLLFMLSELIKSEAHQKHLNIVVSEGKEDICFRITNDETLASKSTPVVSTHGLGLRPRFRTNSGFLQSMARYWGGDLEKVVMGPHTTTYLHFRKHGGKEQIPPVLEEIPHDWMNSLLM